MDGSISYADSDGNKVTDILKTFDVEEQEQHKIDAANAKAVFSPKFIPFYPNLVKQGLTVNETIIYGFIDFYTSNSTGRFYFTNEQIADIVGCSIPTVTRSIKTLEKTKLLTISRKMKANGGQIRFVKPSQIPTNQNDYLQSIKMISSNSSKRLGNKNKINKNKINLNIQADALKEKNYKTQEWQEVALYWKEKMNIPKEADASFFKLFKENLGRAESAARKTIDSGATTPHLMFFKNYHNLNKNVPI